MLISILETTSKTSSFPWVLNTIWKLSMRMKKDAVMMNARMTTMDMEVEREETLIPMRISLKENPRKSKLQKAQRMQRKTQQLPSRNASSNDLFHK
jgi:hypothetical protein